MRKRKSSPNRSNQILTIIWDEAQCNDSGL